MNTVIDYRRERTRKLRDSCSSTTAFSEKIEREPTLISRYIGKNPKLNIGDKMARHIERSFNLPYGELDLPFSDDKNYEQVSIVKENSAKYEYSNVIQVLNKKDLAELVKEKIEQSLSPSDVMKILRETIKMNLNKKLSATELEKFWQKRIAETLGLPLTAITDTSVPPPSSFKL